MTEKRILIITVIALIAIVVLFGILSGCNTDTEQPQTIGTKGILGGAAPNNNIRSFSPTQIVRIEGGHGENSKFYATYYVEYNGSTWVHNYSGYYLLPEGATEYTDSGTQPIGTWKLTFNPPSNQFTVRYYTEGRDRTYTQVIHDPTPFSRQSETTEPETPVDEPEQPTTPETNNPSSVVNPNPTPQTPQTPTPTPTPTLPVNIGHTYTPPVFGALRIVSVRHTVNNDVMVAWEGSGREHTNYRVECTNGYDRISTQYKPQDDNLYYRSVYKPKFSANENYTITVTDMVDNSTDSVTFRFGDHIHANIDSGAIDTISSAGRHSHENFGYFHNHNLYRSTLDGNGNVITE